MKIIKEHIGTINMMELMLNQRKFTTSEIGRGVGVERNKKGKGSYNRKKKYKNANNHGSDNGIFYA
jgi:hypothetical protein